MLSRLRGGDCGRRNPGDPARDAFRQALDDPIGCSLCQGASALFLEEWAVRCHRVSSAMGSESGHRASRALRLAAEDQSMAYTVLVGLAPLYEDVKDLPSANAGHLGFLDLHIGAAERYHLSPAHDA